MLTCLHSRPYDEAAASKILREARVAQGTVRALLGCRKIPVWAKQLVLDARNSPHGEAQIVLEGIHQQLEGENAKMEDLETMMLIGERVPREDTYMQDLSIIHRYIKCSLNAVCDLVYSHKDGTLAQSYAAGQCYFQTYDFE